MTRDELIGKVLAEITVSGSLPNLVKPEEVLRIIEKESIYFYNQYVDATSKDYLVIKLTTFQCAEFKRSRTLILPDCVEGVSQCQEISGWGRFGTIDRDFAEARLLASEIFLTSFSGDDLVIRTAQAAYFDLARAYIKDAIRYEYNKNTRKLKILGGDPFYDVLLTVYNKIPQDRLYDDHTFQDWIIANSKLSFARLVGTFNLALPGNVTINGESMRAEAEAKIVELKEYMKGLDPPNYFQFFHG